MRKHKHEAIIKEWLDNGMPPVEVFDPEGKEWMLSTAHFWFEDKEYRLMYPTKPKKQIKMLCWFNGVSLGWWKKGWLSSTHTRVPELDITIEVDDD